MTLSIPQNEEETPLVIGEQDIDFLPPPVYAVAEVHGENWQIHGYDMQVLHMNGIPPGESIITEVGSTMYLSPGMTTEVECAVCGDARDRIFAGENCIKVRHINDSSSEGYLGLTPNFPAKIIPITLSSNLSDPTAMTTFVARPGAIMSSVGTDVEVGCSRETSCVRCCCAGLGLCRQTIKGTDGTAFLSAGGTIVSKVLADGETIVVDKRSILGFAETVTLDVKPKCDFAFGCCGCEGFFLPTLTGPGLVLLESMSFPKFHAAVQPVGAESINDRGGDDDGDNGGGGDFGGDIVSDFDF